MSTSRVSTGSFSVVDENSSKEVVYVYTLFEETIHLDGKTRDRTQIGKEYRLANGNDINVSPDGLIVEVVTGRKLRRV